MSIVPARDDINSDKTNERSETPFRPATEDQYEGTPSTLPERNNINPDKANKRSNTILTDPQELV